jgi:F-type H+-transporting ATPase subunit b
MDIAVTLVIQGIAFFIAVLAAKYLVWNPLIGTIEQRNQTIAQGLAAGNKAQKDLDEAKIRSQEIIREARDKAVQIVDQASKRAAEIIEEAKQAAIADGQRLKLQAHEEITLETARARETLRKQVASLAVQGASHLLEREIDPKTHAQLLDKLELEMANG